MGTTTSQARERSFYRGNITKQTRPRLDYQNQTAEVMLSTRGRSPRVGDEMPPSSAPETSPRHRGPFVASWPIFAPARGFGDAAGAAGAHRAAAHPAHRRGEERPRARRHDGVEAPLRHYARHAWAAPQASGVAATPLLLDKLLGLNCFLVRARTRGKLLIDRPSVAHCSGRCADAALLRREVCCCEAL